MSEMSGAACRGRWWLFDSTDIRDHEAARDICAACPALAPCAALLREVQVTSKALRASGGGPSGTWAGKLLGKKGYRAEYTLPRCGTDRGYYRHRKDGGDACADCRAAHAKASRRPKFAQVNGTNRTLERVESGAEMHVPHRRANDGEAARSSTTPRGA